MEIASFRRVMDLMTRTRSSAKPTTSPEGYQAVANITKNRVNSRAWGPSDRVGPVLNARKQFSIWNTDDPKLEAAAARVRAIPTNDPRYPARG